MRNRFTSSIVAVGAGLAFSGVLLAQTARQPEGGRTPATTPAPDLSGVWLQSQSEQGGLFRKEPYPMQPWVEEIFIYNQAPGGGNRNEVDPNQAKCFPRGPTSNWLGGQRPFEIFHVRNRVLILFEWNHEIRQIWTDGREHPEDFGHTWMGHSIGKWDGDTLVVDTIGINEHTWLDRDGHVHTNALHLVERLRRADPNTFTLDITFDDPKAYTRPFTARRTFKLAPPEWEIEEHILCEDKLLGKPVPLY